MRFRFCDNDTVALAALGVVCLCAVFMQMESLCSALSMQGNTRK